MRRLDFTHCQGTTLNNPEQNGLYLPKKVYVIIDEVKPLRLKLMFKFYVTKIYILEIEINCTYCKNLSNMEMSRITFPLLNHNTKNNLSVIIIVLDLI